NKLDCLLILKFFFQAEDGIRDFHVTGVQTCALPISRRDSSVINQLRKLFDTILYQMFYLSLTEGKRVARYVKKGKPLNKFVYVRSEERRVGKECSFGW